MRVETASSEGSDRRPIRIRRWRVVHAAAAALARSGVSPNAISIAGMLAAVAAGAFLACTKGQSANDRWLFAAAGALVQLRLLANMLDGLVAIECDRKSATGNLFNEAPDRVSDAVILVGAGFATHASPLLGALAALSAVFVAYLRILGRTFGQPGDYRGPMAKQQRMFVVTVACAAIALLPTSFLNSMTIARSGESRGIMWWALLLIIAGCMATAARRLARMHALLRGKS